MQAEAKLSVNIYHNTSNRDIVWYSLEIAAKRTIELFDQTQSVHGWDRALMVASSIYSSFSTKVSRSREGYRMLSLFF